MSAEFFYAAMALGAISFFFVATQASLSGKSQRQLDEATMLPFADDPEVARRMERATGRSRTGCRCPGVCNGACQHWSDLAA